MEMKRREIILTENISIMINYDEKTDVHTARAEADLIEKICNIIEKADNSIGEIRKPRVSGDAFRNMDKKEFMKDYENGISSGNDNWREILGEKYGFSPETVYNKYSYCKQLLKTSGIKQSLPTNTKEIQVIKSRAKASVWTDDDMKYLEKALKEKIPRKQMIEHLGKNPMQISNKIYNTFGRKK